MPHINRIRVNNVKYNFGTQSYDDFVMRMSGKNTIYDLANGGGKSVLMLLLLQNMIPNCTLDEKQPIEKLFRAGNDNKVIHSLIEWKLNPCHVKDGYVYMTTGFCARKAKEEGDLEKRSTAPIEYFNYCIFYREVNPNDIVNLPLQNGEEKITYQGLKNYLRDIAKKDYSIDVHIFDGKNEYQRFVSQYGIYESEWELIRGINKTEGHVRTFFETHYKTTRKVVEDLFIEEIIEKSYKTQWEGGESGENIAKTLLDIKDKLVELAKKKGEIEHFDHQADALLAFSDRLHSMRGIYGEKAVYEETLVKTCRTINAKLDEMKLDFNTDTDKLSEYNDKLILIEKEIDRAKIAIEEQYLEQLSEDTNSLKARNASLEEDVKSRERNLSLCEAANYYFEYAENEKQMKIQNNAIFDITGKNSDLQSELSALAYHLNKAVLEDKKKLDLEHTALLEKIKQLKAKNEEFTENQNKVELELAIESDKYENNEEQAKQLGQELEELRQLSGLSLAEESVKALEERKNTLFSNKNEITMLREQERSLIEMTARMETRKIQSDEKQAVLEERRAECLKKIADIEASQDKIRQIQEVYDENGEALFSCVEDAYKSRIVKLSNLENQKKQLQLELERIEEADYLENSSEYVSESENQSALYNALKYIIRHYDESAVSGEKFAASLSEDEKAELLKNIPFIGNCIIMNNNLQEAAMDNAILARLSQNENVILITAKAAKEAKSGTHLNISRDVSIIGRIPFVLQSKAQNDELAAKNNEEISAIDKKIELTKDSISVIKEDLFILENGLHKDGELLEQLRKECSKITDEINSLLEMTNDFDDEVYAKKDALTKCSEKIVVLLGNESRLMQEIELFEKINNLLNKYLEMDKILVKGRNSISDLKRQKAQYLSDISKIRNEISADEIRFENIEKLIEQCNAEISKYAPYITGEQFPDINVDKSELEELFCGKVIAFEEKNVDISDKKRMAELYKKSMEKNAADIKYRGFSVEELAELSNQGVIAAMTMEQLSSEKEKLDRAKSRYNDNYIEYNHKQSQYDRQLGTVEYGKNSFKEKFQEEYTSMEEKQSVNALQNYLAEGTSRLKLAKAEGRVLKEQLKVKERNLMTLEALGSELEHLIENYDINMDAYTGILAEDTDLSEACKNIRGDYKRLAKQEQKCRESFEKDKAQLIETLNMLEAKDLSEEIQRQITNPSNVKQIEQYIDNISDTIKCIRLEKSRIGQSIEHMELMKDNFVKQCLQTCISIKEALERLPKLSTIQLDEETINMVQLQIPYIDENMYSQAMDNYISSIVSSVDEIETPAQRLKYIRNQLGWKRLFSVLVKDMDRIKLQLYKRERIKEQSRYLKYEEAVGSTGQSQGIYIQFLVAVINYISSMNSRTNQGDVLRKTIFIDNPFGAAKDVYIWEPIFAMLKSNHVQLIVPARGVTPAITGRFEVNYILGQKLVGNRSQTVVVDYRSQTKEEFLEYKELEYIQSTFEFL